MKTKNIEHGFTFVEILVGLVIALLVAGALISFTRLSFDSHLTISNTMEEIWDSRQTMNLISEELRYAVQADLTADKKSIVFSTLDPSNYENVIQYRLFLNADNYLCIDNGLDVKVITKYPVKALNCEYNKKDPLNKTIDITIEFSDQTTLTTSVIALNDPKLTKN
ncbi:MAG: hypothetical protein GX075_04005 [Firmicutes bacterium]|nr:hypothetical protein [Bacillota bacterium]